MSELSLLEQFARRGRVKEFVRVSSGSPEDVLIQPLDGLAGLKAISAIRALAYRGPSLAKAKRAVEDMIEEGKAFLALSTVESRVALIAELAEAGVMVRILTPPEELAGGDLTGFLPALRARLDMTQEAFALQYGFELKTLQGWEQGRKVDRAVLSYLRLIDRDPVAIARLADSA